MINLDTLINIFYSRTELRKDNDEYIVNDDTQAGIEFAYEQIQKSIEEAKVEDTISNNNIPSKFTSEEIEFFCSTLELIYRAAQNMGKECNVTLDEILNIYYNEQLSCCSSSGNSLSIKDDEITLDIQCYGPVLKPAHIVFYGPDGENGE